ncbi:MAG: MBL fold metallo-hydrolase [Thermomicrobiales bacterium]
MQIEILGSGGALATPRAGCACRICVEARAKGIPYARSGPSTFIHGPDILFDTPEESREQLVRAGVARVAACFYSHWHPDHVMGRRVWESLNVDVRGWTAARTTDVYLPEQVAIDFRRTLGTMDHLAFLEHQGVIRIIELRDGEQVTVGDVRVTPFRLAETYVYAFLVEDEARRVLIAPDELHNWSPPAHLAGLDLAVLPMGIVEIDPFTGERRLEATHPLLAEEATFSQTIELARALDARRIIFSHIEESDGLGHDDLGLLAERLRADGLPATFAYDTMGIDLA